MTALFITGGIAIAQQRDGRNMDPKERAKQMTEQMAKDYSLTAEQKEKVSALNTEMTEKMSKITTEDREARRTEMQKIREDYDVKVKNILTTEQHEKYVKAEKERRERPRNR